MVSLLLRIQTKTFMAQEFASTTTSHVYMVMNGGMVNMDWLVMQMIASRV